MKNCRVLIIYGSPLFADAVSRLLEAEQVTVVGQTNELAEAQSILQGQQVDAVIVDHDDIHLQNANLISQLVTDEKKRLLIFLKMTGNLMIVHHQERFKNVTPTDLLRAVRSTVSVEDQT